MVMVLFKKAIRSMLEHQARYIGAILLLIISSTMFVMLNNASTNLGNAFTSFSEQNVLSDAEFAIDSEIDLAAAEERFGAKVELGGTADCEIRPGQTLRIFSMMNKVNELILDSNTLIVVIGYLLGIPALLGTVGVFYQSLTESLQLILPVKLNVWYMILGFFIVMTTYEIAKLLCRKKVARIPMSEALKAGNE